MAGNAGHLKFQPSDILTRPGRDDGFNELKVILPGKYVGEDVWSIEWSSLWGAVSVGGAEVDANDAGAFTSESFTTEGAGGGEARRSLGNDLFAAT